MKILGIVNLTRDSFSDGGRYLDTDAALAHARQLVNDGADVIDLGAESTNPDGEDVSADEERRRLEPLIEALTRQGVAVSIDTSKPAVMRAALRRGAAMINDVNALRTPDAIDAVRDTQCPLILMHSIAAGPRAARADVPANTIVDRILCFFEERIATLASHGVTRERLILDPGMGFFLGRDPSVSLTVLRNIERLRTFGLPLCISVSRKSFIGAVLGTGGGPSRDAPRPVGERGAGTLAAELWALAHSVEYIRTHDVRSLSDAARVWQAIQSAGSTGT